MAVISNSEEKKLNKMNRASQNVNVGTILKNLEGSTGSAVNITGGTISGVGYPHIDVSASSVSYTVQPSDFTIRCNASTGSIVINLLPAVNSGRIHNVKNLYTSACIVKVIADTSGTPDLIDGDADQTLTPKSSMMIQDNATNHWDIL
jgi:hypothetical protein